MASKTTRGKKLVSSYTIPGTDITITRGSCVVLTPIKSHEPPYIGRVVKLKLEKDNEMTVRVQWYYRPEDTDGRRRSYHGTKELFLSNLYDWQSIESIESLCVVHTLEEYMELESTDDDDYFCRFKYDAKEPPANARDRFSPKYVPVYCKCEMPYNPDHDMVQCDQCMDWYHPNCIGKRFEDVKNQETFSCFRCQDDEE